MAKRCFDPRLEVLDERAGMIIWRVDGWSIRDNLDVEFTTMGHSYDTLYIPEDELWLDREAPGTEEWRAWAIRGLHEIALQDAGMSELAAIADGAHAEMQYRRTHHDTEELYLGSLGCNEGWKIYLVHGCFVRDHLYIDFVHGGHSNVYAFIPKGEIWIDDVLAPGEVGATIVHEAFEATLMARGLSYIVAHALASQHEARFRGGAFNSDRIVTGC